MALSLSRALATLVALFGIIAPAYAQGKFPCHNKNVMGEGVTCTKVALPKNLCTSCPLRPPKPRNGHFVNCKDIYDTSAPTCLPAMKEYVAANPCDAKRGKAVEKFAENPDNNEARIVIDFFLYAVCEQCCDCVPMGANKSLYGYYLASHTAKKPTLYASTRGNCPAHAVHDICKAVPKITHFTTIGDNDDAEFDKMPPACPMLRDWLRSGESRKWQTNPKTKLEPALDTFMLNALEHLQCGKKDIWETCYELEGAQNNLGKPEALPTPTTSSKPEVKTPAPSSSGTPSAAVATPAVANGTTPSPGPATKEGTVNGNGSAAAGTNETAPQASPEGGPPCFPASATVELRSGARVPMSDLRIGQEVRVANNKFSTVYLFSHRDPSFRTTHLRVTVSSGEVLTLTPGHYLPVNGIHAPASSIAVGDDLDGLQGKVSVVRVSKVMEHGLYNPHTTDGTIVVDNIVCSCYTSAVAPSTAQALLAPIRALFRAGAVTESSAGHFLQYGAESLPVPLPL